MTRARKKALRQMAARESRKEMFRRVKRRRHAEAVNRLLVKGADEAFEAGALTTYHPTPPTFLERVGMFLGGGLF